jgi:hypothetical protein
MQFNLEVSFEMFIKGDIHILSQPQSCACLIIISARGGIIEIVASGVGIYPVLAAEGDFGANCSGCGSAAVGGLTRPLNFLDQPLLCLLLRLQFVDLAL